MSGAQSDIYVRDLEAISNQERALELPFFDEEFAWRLGSWLRMAATAHAYPVAIDVRRSNQRLFSVCMPGAVPDNLRWIERKSNTALHFHRSSYAVGLSLQQAGSTLAQKYALPESRYCVHGGAFPLRLTQGGVVGSVCSSGLPQRMDHGLVVEALCYLLEIDAKPLRLPP